MGETFPLASTQFVKKQIFLRFVRREEFFSNKTTLCIWRGSQPNLPQSFSLKITVSVWVAEHHCGTPCNGSQTKHPRWGHFAANRKPALSGSDEEFKRCGHFPDWIKRGSAKKREVVGSMPNSGHSRGCGFRLDHQAIACRCCSHITNLPERNNQNFNFNFRKKYKWKSETTVIVWMLPKCELSTTNLICPAERITHGLLCNLGVETWWLLDNKRPVSLGNLNDTSLDYRLISLRNVPTKTRTVYLHVLVSIVCHCLT